MRQARRRPAKRSASARRWSSSVCGGRRGCPGKAPRCVKDVIEEKLFERRKDLFTGLSLVFFDTTSIYFEGEGGESIGQFGFSKDHRPDRKQMVVGVDRADREAILAALEDKLKQGDKALVGNKGYRKYLKSHGRRFEIDRRKVRDEARFDGKWVLRTNWHDADAAEVALRYKDLWMVEAIFRTTKSILETRPVYHRCDETIRGHVFCSFLALVLRKSLMDRLAACGDELEWADVQRDLAAMSELTLDVSDKRYLLRTPARGAAAKAFTACRIAPPAMLRELET